MNRTDSSSSSSDVDRPNILFILSDDHATQAISSYGSRLNETPNIDRLAEQGMRFDNAFVTNSICAPSRAVILTGKYSHKNEITGNQMAFDGSQQTFPKLLRQAGYETGLIGKWHLKTEPTGFDFWKKLPMQGTYYNPLFETPDGDEQYRGYTTDIITDLAMDWMEKEQDENNPFMLMVHHKTPHRWVMPDLQDLHRFEDRTLPEPISLTDDFAHRSSAPTTDTSKIINLPKRDMKITEDSWDKYPTPKKYWKRFDDPDLNLQKPWGLTPDQLEKWNAFYKPKNKAFKEANLEGIDLLRWKYQRFVKDYLRTIVSLDRNVGRLLDHLEESGLSENTIVIYASDQGFFLGQHGWFSKHWMYEESLRMPLIVRWPGVTDGSANKDLVLNLDLAETFLDVAGADVPDDMQGRSLVPLLKGNTPSDWRQSMYYHFYQGSNHGAPEHLGVRTNRYKLIHFYKRGEWEMYDLDRNPNEMRSVYDDPTYADVRSELKEKIQELQSKYDVPQEDTR